MVGRPRVFYFSSLEVNHMKNLFIFILSCILFAACSGSKSGLENAVSALESEIASDFEEEVYKKEPDRVKSGYHSKFQIVDIQLSSSNPDVAQVAVDRWAEDDFGQRLHMSQSLALYDTEHIHKWRHIGGKWQPITRGEEHNFDYPICIYDKPWRKDKNIKAEYADEQKTLKNREGIHIPLMSLMKINEMKGKPRGGFFNFNGDGTMLAVSEKGHMTLWDVETKKEIKSINIGGQYAPGLITFGPDGKNFAIKTHVGEDTETYVLLLIEIDTGQVQEKFVGPRIELSKDWKLLLVGGNRSFEIYDFATRKKIKTVKVNSPRYSTRFSPDGQVLTYKDNNKLILWDTTTWSPKNTIAISEDTFIRFSPDGRLIAAVSDKVIKLIDVATGTITNSISETFIGVTVSFSSDGHILAFGTKEGIKLLNVTTGSVEHDLHGFKTYGFVFSPDGMMLLAEEAYNKTVFYDINSKSRITSIDKPMCNNWIEFSPDNKKIAFVSEGTPVILDALGLYLWSLKSDGIPQRLENIMKAKLNAPIDPKGEFETIAEYESRVKAKEEDKDKIRKEYDVLIKAAKEKVDVALNEAKSKLYPWSFEVVLGNYDADKQVFEVDIFGNKTIINVPIEVAKQIGGKRNAIVEGMIKWDGSDEGEYANAYIVIGEAHKFAFGKHFDVAGK